MIVQKANKKKLYTNIAVLVIVFGLTGYLILTNFVSFGGSGNSASTQDDLASGGVAKSKFKYEKIEKIEKTVLDDPRYKILSEPKRGLRPSLEKGNKEIFKSE